MPTWKQIGLGSLLLGLCVVVHVAVLGAGVDLLQSIAQPGSAGGGRLWITVVLLASGVVLIGHTLQVWIWALVFRALGALSDLGEAIYFSLVTTTTLGYGDVTLDERFRVFGAMGAVAGLMTYGLSTAFLVGVASGILTSRT